ncbi:hypothetical protein CRUP_022676 [Coryphaenoides rupestris]|nr:hypothetical protein CRUP_022676 [Coryphaenoides rupestris]
MERYALVFGANNFGALVLQTIFTIYASYFAIIAVLFTLRGAFTAWKGRSRSQEPACASDSGPPDPGAGLEDRL